MVDKKIKIEFIGDRLLTKDDSNSRPLYDQSRFGEPNTDKKMEYSLVEALHLLEKDKATIHLKKKKLSKENYIKKIVEMESNFWTRYCVYNDLRKRGYIVKTALKFGADFRVYDRGIKPGEDHAKWIVFPVKETETLTWYSFSAKNRVAHSTRKRLLIGIVDEENDVTYYSVEWVRP